MTYSYLHIPQRFRKTRQGYYTFCTACNKNYTDTCGETGKKIHTCKTPEAHRFQSKKKKPKVYKTWDKELRDLNEFFKLHQLLVENSEQSNVILLKDQPGLLLDCLKMYGDHIQDINVNSYEKKGNTDKYVKGQLNNLRHFVIALREKDIEPAHLAVSELSEIHASTMHDYLNEKAASTYNNIIATLRAFLDFLIDKDYPVKNIFKKVRYKTENTNTEIVTMEEFDKLLKICTEANGVKLESKGGGRIGRKLLYKPWLIDVWKYALYSGCRPEEIANARVSDENETHIICTNYKVTKLQKVEQIRMIPKTDELMELRKTLIKKQKLKGDDYLLAPEEENRMNVLRVASEAFSHYWKQISDRKIKFYDLRNTYASYMLEMMGEKFQGRVGLHKKLITTLQKYSNEEKALNEMNGRSVYG